jgi:hypothetical protein
MWMRIFRKSFCVNIFKIWQHHAKLHDANMAGKPSGGKVTPCAA